MTPPWSWLSLGGVSEDGAPEAGATCEELADLVTTIAVQRKEHSQDRKHQNAQI